jgi:hypothetical protein
VLDFDLFTVLPLARISAIRVNIWSNASMVRGSGGRRSAGFGVCMTVLNIFARGSPSEILSIVGRVRGGYVASVSIVGRGCRKALRTDRVRFLVGRLVVSGEDRNWIPTSVNLLNLVCWKRGQAYHHLL